MTRAPGAHTRAVRRGPLAVVLLTAFVSTLLTVAQPAAPAEAASASEFDPGYIISDALFYDGSAMTESQIQKFLESKSGSCQNSRCLDILKVDTKGNNASLACKKYDGAKGELVSRIIYRMQTLCNVSAKVLLVTLQKEQGLVTSTAPTTAQIKYATGYACPDTGNGCDPARAGIENQLYWAARSFGGYRLDNRPGPGTWNIKYHPTSSCGTKKVQVRNDATAALYIYTPYTPNAAAMANLNGTGDKCSSYGNRNFWRFYTDWFGSPIGQLSSDVEASRVAGADRYETSTAVSQDSFPDPAAVTTVFVASGQNFPDGLAAGPAAALVDAPLLLTKKSSLPTGVRNEIQRLAPEQIVVVGGTPAVSSSVVKELEKIAPVTRVSGADRYATSRAIARHAFPDGADAVFIAIGNNFPDALASSAAGGELRMPVILVRKGASSADTATRNLIAELGATRVVAAGSSTVIKSGYLNSLKNGTSVTSTVRLGGPDRYATAALINDYAFPEAELSYMASGANFPDALSAAAVAGAQSAPLHLSPGKCLKATAVLSLTAAGVERVVFVGSSKVLSSAAFGFKPC